MVPDAAVVAGVCSAGDVICCVGSSLLLESSPDCGRGAVDSLSDDLGIHSLSDGRLSLSNSCMSGQAIPR
jgi:hypothetical protein